MAITTAMCSSFKQELLLGAHDFRATAGDTFKVALYVSAATLGASTTAYSATNEASGTGYSAAGNTLTRSGTSLTSTTAFTDFSDSTWSTATVTARGCLIYNSTPSANAEGGGALTNPAVAAFDFGADKTSTAGDFTLVFPTADSTNAIIRLA